MKIRAVILAGGTGARLSVLTARRTKPAIPFAGKYRIIDFPLSNCVNSNIFDVVVIAQYRPHSLIDHIKAGSPWDLNRDFSGGIRILTPYTAKSTGWFIGTADAIRQNMQFILADNPDLLLILSGDQIYFMDYQKMVQFHLEKNADITIGVIQVPIEEASRFGVLTVDSNQRVTSFTEKPTHPSSNLINMGVYLFNSDQLDAALWMDEMQQDSSHDFGKDILPTLLDGSARIFAYLHSGYWVDVGTTRSYWQAHMDMLTPGTLQNLFNQKWIIHTRTEERPPAYIHAGAAIENSLICHGCLIENGAKISNSVLSQGVHVKAGANINQSILFTDCIINENVQIQRAILDRFVQVGKGSRIGLPEVENVVITMIGKSTIIAPNVHIYPGGIIGPNVLPSDIPDSIVRPGEYIQSRNIQNEI